MQAPAGRSAIRFFTLVREGDGTIVELLVISWGRDREEHRGRSWPAGAYLEAKRAIRTQNDLISASQN
jgi:hypothetical protein